MSTNLAIILLGSLGAILLAVAGYVLIGKRRSGEDKERARRRYLCLRGRVIEAEVTDIQGTVIAYAYEVAGVTYHVVQDVAPFAEFLPRDPHLLLGPAAIRYLPANPANSIVIGEDWSGVRISRPLERRKGA